MKYTIIGAGIGGLTTAVALEQKGIEYEVFEKAPVLMEVGAGIWLAPNALYVMDSLHLLQEIQAAGNKIDRFTVGQSDLSVLTDSHQESFEEIFGYSTIAIHRAKLQKLLLDQIPKEKVKLGKNFSSFNLLNNDKLEIKFKDGTSTVTDYLIGADGINSAVRRQLFPKSHIRYSGQTCWRGVSDFVLEKEFTNRGLELWGNQIRFGFSKIAQAKVYWFAVALSSARGNDDAEVVEEKLLKMYNNFHPLINQIIASTDRTKILRNDINDLQPMKQWYKGNVCLIGDAGHATTPNMGQGGAQAIEDAYYLSNLIASTPNENVFHSFQNKRKAKVNAIVKQSWMTGKMAHWKYGRGFRNFMMKNIPKKMMEKKMIEMYTVGI